MTTFSFDDLLLIEPLRLALEETGYKTPTPIQQQAIPPLLAGRDLIGCAQTGTGKTAAFALPILNKIAVNRRPLQGRRTRVLILTPTRELAIQILESFRTYGKHLKLKYAVVFGGVGQGPQVKALAGGVDILVATPGRLLDLIEQKHLSLQGLDVFVLDEADRMLDMGFIRPIQRIIKMLPEKRHNLFFSATMPPAILELASTMLVDPVRVEVTPVSSTAERIQQSIMNVEKDRKRDLLRHVLKDPEFRRVIVFTRTKHGANRVSETLAKNGVTAEAIHGNKSQTARQKALENFRNGRTRVLIATDIAARGIDIDHVSHVINFELPNVAETYVHRIGRTARAGMEGKAISFCDQEERAYLRDIEKLIGQKVPVDADHPYHIQHQGPIKAAPPEKPNRGRRPNRGGGGGKPRSGGGGGRGGGRSGGTPGSGGGNGKPRGEQRQQPSSKKRR
ncbi:MAG: DEAD/DEAH box helicase [Bdellovibrionales bacterium]|jgi:ATP-dependent RNA helicase RhlE|nr:DEAD/DEAH box helicase [Bdellovibrionales bacterium]